MPVIVTSQFDLQAKFPIEVDMVVNDLPTRDDISEWKRYEGKITYVKSEHKLFILVNGETNLHWEEIAFKNSLGEYIPLSWLDIDPDMTADSDEMVPSQKAVKTAIENQKDNWNIIEW